MNKILIMYNVGVVKLQHDEVLENYDHPPYIKDKNSV